MLILNRSYLIQYLPGGLWVTKVKIKIVDDTELRKELNSEYETSSQEKLCKYALLLATHILELISYPDMENDTIKEGFFINDQWQKGNARMHDVRQAGFKIHQMAKASDDDVTRTALRVVGQAVATGHMKEHAMVASDYAVKVINLLYPNDMYALKNERLWQINHLKEIED